MISQLTVYDVFQKVLGHLGLWARDPEADPGALDVGFVSLTLGADPLTLIPHPFVCERGYVRADVAPSHDVSAMVREVSICTTHSYEDVVPVGDQVSGVHCRMHPAVTDAQLAIWALGGPDAVTTRRDPRMRQGFDERVYTAWYSMLGRFRTAVQEYDRHLASSDALNVGRLVKVGRADDDEVYKLAEITIKLRPGERRKRKRRK